MIEKKSVIRTIWTIGDGREFSTEAEALAEYKNLTLRQIYDNDGKFKTKQFGEVMAFIERNHQEIEAVLKNSMKLFSNGSHDTNICACYSCTEYRKVTI